MAKFGLNGVTLALPDALLTDQLVRAFSSGQYESSEAAALLRHIRPSDVFVDLGAGAGYLTALAGQTARSVAGVEALPDMAEVARRNLARNGVSGEILWGAVVPDTCAATRVTFSQRRSFWASSLTPPADARGTAQLDVPALRFSALMDRFSPSLLSMDIEGGELALFSTPLPASLRLLVMELHPAVYGPEGVRTVFDALSAQGFAYCPEGSRAATVVFSRITVARF